MAKRNARSITEANLQAVAEKRALITRLEAELKTAKAAVLESLKAGVTVAPGLLTARVKTYERRNVAWKEILVRERARSTPTACSTRRARPVTNRSSSRSQDR